MYGFRAWISLADKQTVVQRNVTLMRYDPATLVLESCLHGGSVTYETSDIVEFQVWPEHELAATFQRNVATLNPLVSF